MKVLNFGSLNIDYSFKVDHLVKPGETEASSSFLISCGGKGLNQSIALKRAGIDVYHAGAVGKKDGKILLDALNNESIDTSCVYRLKTNSGTAFIQVDKKGENTIIINGGSNTTIDEKIVDEVLQNFFKGDYIILQNEISSLGYIIDSAYKKQMKIVLNPSPINDMVKNLPLEKVSIFFLNSLEAKFLAETDKNVLDNLIKKYPNSQFVITAGSDNVTYYDGKNVHTSKPLKITPVDTTAAGDTFLGYFIASIIKNKKDALSIACKASAIACLRRGASLSIPTSKEVENYKF